MDLTVSILNAMGILLVFAGIGWALQARGFLKPGVGDALGVLSLDVALPCLVFTSILGGFRPAEFPGWWRLPLTWGAFTAVAALLAAAAGWLAPASIRREFRLSLLYQNAIFIPVALLSELFGPVSRPMVSLLLFTVFFPAFFFTTYPLFYGAARRPQWRRLLHPVLFATLAGMALGAAGAGDRIPAFLTHAAQQVGATSVPLLLILIGGRLRQDVAARGVFHFRSALVFVAVKNVLFPLAALAAVHALPVSREVAWLIVMQAAMPPVTATPLVVERAGGRADVAGQLLLASFAASAVTVPLALAALARLWPA